MSLDIEPQYLPQDEDSDQNNNDSGLIDPEAQGEEDYGEEDVETAEFVKIKKSKVFQQIDYTKRKTKVAATLG
jgi:hypothetical protein